VEGKVLAMKIIMQGIEILVEDCDHYLQINDISSTDLRIIWEQIKTEYPNYEKWFCFRNTDVPIALLDELGAVIEDDCTQMRLFPDKLIHSASFDIERVTNETFNEFAALHDARITNMYWTGERLGRDISKWGIFCLRHNKRITDYLIMSMRDPYEAEIFCVEASDGIKCKELIAFAAKFAFDNGKNNVLYMSDDNVIYDAALSVGFAVTGFYKGYGIKPSR